MLLRFRRRPEAFAGLRGACAPLVAVLGLALVAGCDTSTLPGSDAGASDAGPPPLVLSFVTEGPLGLPFGTSTSLEVSLTDAMGAPVSSEPVSFAIEGTGADSSLGDLFSTTDFLGRARVVLRAGDRPATYRVRANHPAASAVWLDVTVAASFGRLAVRPTNAFAPIESYRVALLVGVPCSGAAMAPAARERVIGRDTDTARFDALAADATYTAFVRGLVGAREVAEGCVSDIPILADTETTIEVPVRPLPLVLLGEYEAAVTLDLRSGSEAVTVPFVTAASSAVGGAEQDAVRLLVALQAALAGDAAGLAALERLRPTAGSLLGSSLVADGSVPSEAVPEVLGRALDALTALRLEADLEFVRGDVPTFTPRRAIADEGTGAPLSLELTLGPALVAATFSTDRLAIDRLAFSLPLGRLLAATLEAQRVRAGLESTGALLGTGSCATLDRFIDGDGALASSCGPRCRESACNAALDATLALALASGTDLDAMRATLELTGSMEVRDEDRDLVIDAISGALEGTYGSSGTFTGGAVTGTLAAARPLG